MKLLRNERREGFVASAIRAADAAESDTLVLLRGPALLAPTALRPLAETLDVDGPKTGLYDRFSAHQPGGHP